MKDAQKHKENIKLFAFFLIVFFFALSHPAHAFYEYKGEQNSFKGRMAIDLMSGFTHYPEPEILYPKDSEGFNSATSRLLLDAGLGENTSLDFNGYLYASSNEQDFFSDDSTTKYSPYRYPQAYWKISQTNDMLICGEIDQLSYKYHTQSSNLTLGRQPINLSNNFIFTPDDFFYPFAATAVDREFRTGVDALRYDYDITDLSTISAIGVAGYDGNDPSWEKSAALIKAGVNIKSIDMSVIAGKTDTRRLVGLTLSAEAVKLGLRLEGNYSHPTEGDAHADFFQISAGVDKRWDNSLHIMLEYFYHGNGKSNPNQYLEYAENNPDTMDTYMGRNYAGLFIQGDATPLLKLQGALIANLEDGSLLFGPGMIYSISDEAELIIGGSIPYGETASFDLLSQSLNVKSEFGLYPRTVYLLGRIYF